MWRLGAEAPTAQLTVGAKAGARTDTGPVPDAPPATRRIRVSVLLVPIIVLHVAGTLADWFAPALLAHAPLLELFLNPRLRYMALVADRVGTVAFFSVALIRLVMLDPLYYFLGRWYGDAAVRW